MSRGRVPILVYHQVAPRPRGPAPLNPGNYVEPERFAAHLDWLRDRGYRTVRMRDLAEPGAPGGRRVALTFDDGYRSFLESAWPELARRGMTATVFAVSGEIGGENRWDSLHGERRAALLTAEELRRLDAAQVEIGSHSHSHPDLTTLDRDRLVREVEGSRRELEAVLGRSVESFCYPYARFDRTVRTAVAEAGYRTAVSVWGWPGADPRDPLALPRGLVPPGARGLELRLLLSSVYPIWRRLPRLGLLRSARSGGGGGG